MQQKGYRERLLCRDCEAHLNAFESHSHRMFARQLPPILHGTSRVREFPGIDYTRLKLFLLSILWRSSVSNHPFFNGTNLTPLEENLIRDHLLLNDAGDEFFFPTILFNLHYDGAHFRDFMTNVTPADDPRCHRLVLAGFLIIIYGEDFPLARGLFMNPNEPVRSYDVEFEDWSFLRESRDEFVRSHFWREPKQVDCSPSEPTWTESL